MFPRWIIKQSLHRAGAGLLTTLHAVVEITTALVHAGVCINLLLRIHAVGLAARVPATALILIAAGVGLPATCVLGLEPATFAGIKT